MQNSMQVDYGMPTPVDASSTACDGLDTVVSLVQSAGVELAIFAVTLVVALVMRHQPAFKQGGCAASVERPPTSAARQRSQRETSEPLKAPQRSACELIHAILAAGGSVKALSLYAELRTLPLDTIVKALRTTTQQPEALFNAVLLVAGRTDRPDVVVRLLLDMVRMDLPRSLALYESAMRLLAKKNRWKEALQVNSMLEKDGLEPSATTLGCLVNFAAEGGDYEAAVQFFDRVAAKDVPSIRAYMSVLRILAKTKDWQRSFQIFRDCQANGVADSTALNIVLSTAVNAGAVKQAATLLTEAANRKPPIVDTVSFNTVLKGVAQQNDAETALLLVNRMEELSIRFSSITFNTAIDATMRCSRSEDAWALFLSMRSQRIKPDKFTCSTLVKGAKFSSCEQLGYLLDAYDVASNQCSPQLKSSLLNAVMDRVTVLGTSGACSSEFTSALRARVREAMGLAGVVDLSVAFAR